jgi:RimJ/RimL family protein N-acetyltransferase
MELRIRPAKNSDCELLWEWVNDPEVRRASFVTQDVTLEEHTKWFWARMADRNTTIFIAMLEETPVGVVRFDRDSGEAKISVTIAKPFRNRGFGAAAIRLASIAHKHAYDEKIVAHIKRENASSINSFFKAGYILEDTMTEGDVPSVVMTFE